MAESKIQCPSVTYGSDFVHEPCTAGQGCVWWKKRCTAADTIDVAKLIRRPRKKKLACGLSPVCRWSVQAPDGVCPPMKLGEICEHQGGTFNTFLLEDSINADLFAPQTDRDGPEDQ